MLIDDGEHVLAADDRSGPAAGGCRTPSASRSNAARTRTGTRWSRRSWSAASGSAGWPRSTARAAAPARGHARGRRGRPASCPPRSSCRAVAEQEERLAQAELRALRAQISPHFIYNALAAVATYIHTRPEEARELLTEFAEFTRYAFRGNRPYVTLADELHYVEKYLRLEKARFGDRLEVRVRSRPRC